MFNPIAIGFELAIQQTMARF